MTNTIDDLLRIMATLRDPERGCPWDVKQSFETIASYTIEEAYEVADAIDRKDYADLRDELGDLLLQVVFHSRMAEEEGRFAFADVVESICEKMIRRHPHVFPDAEGKRLSVEDADAQTAVWEELKRRERMDKSDADTSVLAGIARGLPEWQRAYKLQKRASTVGFDWSEPGPVLDKLQEEIGEVRSELAAVAASDPDDAVATAANRARLLDEIGDVLFVAVNLARLAKVDYSQALRAANAKFERRFRRMETLAQAQGTRLQDQSLAEQDAYWERAKVEDKAGLL
jgi:ATP diphosphatase